MVVAHFYAPQPPVGGDPHAPPSLLVLNLLQNLEVRGEEASAAHTKPLCEKEEESQLESSAVEWNNPVFLGEAPVEKTCSKGCHHDDIMMTW